MKKLLLLGALLSVVSISFGQTESEKRSTFQISFVPPLSTNGSRAHEYTNTVSLNILTGVSRNEKAFSVAGLANIIKRDACGFQAAGLANTVGGHERGAMIAGLANTLGMRGEGVMIAGLANVAGRTYRGLQLSGLGNSAGKVDGFQLGGLGNFTGEADGFQLGGLGNFAGEVDGFQLGGLGNFAGEADGFQLGGLGNFAGEANGFQLGGLGNFAGKVDGVQFAGVFNVAGNVSGVQFASLVNIAESCDYPIAMLNIIRNGEYAVGVSYNDIGSILVNLRSGGRVTYGILGVGYNHKAEGNGFTTEGGFGAHINIAPWFRLNNEIKGGVIGNFSSVNVFYSNYALLPAFRLSDHFELFGGPSVNYMQSDNTANRGMFPDNSIWDKYTDDKLQQVFIGWQAGVQFVF